MSGDTPRVGCQATEESALEAYQRTISIYSNRKFAQMYFAKWGSARPDRQLDDFARRIVRGGAILDAGCGPGHHTEYLNALGFMAVGVDLSFEVLKLAIDHYPSTRFVRCNMLQTPFPDSAFSGVWACASFVHLPETLYDSQFAEFGRLLHDEGILALTLTVGQVAHIDAFGRFFQTSPDFTQLRGRLHQYGFEVVNWERRVLQKTTEGGEQSAEWGTVTARKTS